MDNQNSTADVEVIFEEELEMLDESKHFNSTDLVREINRLRKELNKRK